MSSSICPSREHFCTEHARHTSLLHKSRGCSVIRTPASVEKLPPGCYQCGRQQATVAQAPGDKFSILQDQRRPGRGGGPFRLGSSGKWTTSPCPVVRTIQFNSGLKMNKLNQMFECSSTSVSPFHGVSILSSRCKSKAHTGERIRTHKRNGRDDRKARAPLALASRAVLQLMFHR